MENEEIKEELDQRDTWSLYDQIPEKMDLTFRDDQHDFDWLMDALREKRRRGVRFRLVDSGVFDGNQLEALTSAGADLYTSDRERKNVSELEFILKAAGKGGAIVADFIHGNLSSDEAADLLSLFSLSHLGREGLYVHMSNREIERNFSDLIQIALQCRKGSSHLVYYHHGQITPEFVDLGTEGVWIHISDRSVQSEEDILILIDTITAARSAGTNCVLYIEKGMSFSPLHDVLKSGAVVLFKTAPTDYKSLLRPLEDEAKRKRLDFRAYYLYSAFLP